MHTTTQSEATSPPMQFGLLTLMELVTLCGGVFASAKVIGVPSSICLAMMAFALMARHGLLAIILMATAMSVGNSAIGNDFSNELAQQLFIILIGVALSLWFRVRRR